MFWKTWEAGGETTIPSLDPSSLCGRSAFVWLTADEWMRLFRWQNRQWGRGAFLWCYQLKKKTKRQQKNTDEVVTYKNKSSLNNSKLFFLSYATKRWHPPPTTTNLCSRWGEQKTRIRPVIVIWLFLVLNLETMIQKRIINERMKTSKHQNTAFHRSSLGLCSKNNPQ